jgi:proline dehydrogenase
MSRRPASTASHFVLAVTFLGVFFLMCNSAFAQDKTGSGDKIKELKESRLVLLEKIHRFAIEALKQGDPKITFAQVHQTQAGLLAARLDLAEKKEDRIKICEDAVNNAEAWQESVRRLVETGRESGIRILQAQAYVLETRIALEKAKAAK